MEVSKAAWKAHLFSTSYIVNFHQSVLFVKQKMRPYGRIFYAACNFLAKQ